MKVDIESFRRKLSETFDRGRLIELANLTPADALNLHNYGVIDIALSSRASTGLLQYDSDMVAWFYDWLEDLGFKMTVALELGCRSGGLSLRLASFFDHVDGLDWRPELVNQGCGILDQGTLEARFSDQPEFVSQLSSAQCDRVSLHIVDFSRMHPDYFGQDAVVLSELPDSTRTGEWLEKQVSDGLIKSDGVLLVASGLCARERDLLYDQLAFIDSFSYVEFRHLYGTTYELHETEASLWHKR